MKCVHVHVLRYALRLVGVLLLVPRFVLLSSHGVLVWGEGGFEGDGKNTVTAGPLLRFAGHGILKVFQGICMITKRHISAPRAARDLCETSIGSKSSAILYLLRRYLLAVIFYVIF